MAENQKSKLPLFLGGLGLLYFFSKRKNNNTTTLRNFYQQYKDSGMLELDEIERQTGGKYIYNMPTNINLPNDLSKIIYDPEASEKADSIVPFIVPNSVRFQIVEHDQIFPSNYLVVKEGSDWSGTLLERYPEDKILVCDFLFDFFVPTTPSHFIITKFDIEGISLFYNGSRLLDNAVCLEMFTPDNTSSEFWYGDKNVTNYYMNFFTKGIKITSGHNVFSIRLMFPYRYKGYMNRFRQEKIQRFPDSSRYYNQFDYFNPFNVMDQLIFTLNLGINNHNAQYIYDVINDSDVSNNTYNHNDFTIKVRNKNEYSVNGATPLEQRAELIEYLNYYNERMNG